MIKVLSIRNIRATSKRGFTLLITMILTAVILGIGLALLDISYKQVTLAASARQSTYAFYNADSALECALYWDSLDTFDYNSFVTSGSIFCQGQGFSYSEPIALGGQRTVTFTIPCAGDSTPGDGSGDVTIIKQSSGSTQLYANGYNTCVATNPERVERGEEAHY